MYVLIHGRWLLDAALKQVIELKLNALSLLGVYMEDVSTFSHPRTSGSRAKVQGPGSMS